MRAQDYAQAESLITEFLAVEPQSVAMLELYGELYGEKGDAANAVIQYGKAIELLLKHPEPGMPTLHEELFEKVTALAPDSPDGQEADCAHAWHCSGGTAGSDSIQDLCASGSCDPIEPDRSTETFSTANAAPDDAWNVTSKITPLQDRHVSLAEPKPCQAQSEPSQSAEPEPVTLGLVGSHCRMPSRTRNGSRCRKTSGSVAPLPPVLSTSEQFQAYVEAGQQAEAEEWLSRLVTAQPDHAEARELFGSLLEAKGDTAGAALQYSRALELLLAHPNDESPTRSGESLCESQRTSPGQPVGRQMGLDVFAEAAGVSTCRRDAGLCSELGTRSTLRPTTRWEWPTRTWGCWTKRRKSFVSR